jgi:hypothetical protein
VPTASAKDARRDGPCPACGTFCTAVGGIPECTGASSDHYVTRYRCGGHPLGPVGNNCGWEGVLSGSDTRDPQCPSCGGWVVKQAAAKLRRVK